MSSNTTVFAPNIGSSNFTHKKDTTLHFIIQGSSKVTLRKSSLLDLPEHSTRDRCSRSLHEAFFLPTVCTDKCSERCGAVEFNHSEQVHLFWREEEKESLWETMRALKCVRVNSIQHTPHPPPIPPVTDPYLSAYWFPMSQVAPLFHGDNLHLHKRAGKVKSTYFTQMLTLGCTSTRTHITAAQCVLHNNCVYSDGG